MHDHLERLRQRQTRGHLRIPGNVEYKTEVRLVIADARNSGVAVAHSHPHGHAGKGAHEVLQGLAEAIGNECFANDQIDFAAAQLTQFRESGMKQFFLSLGLAIVSAGGLAGLGQPDMPAPTFEELHVQRLLQSGELPADGRGGDIEMIACGAHRAEPGGFEQIAQSGLVAHVPSGIRKWHRFRVYISVASIIQHMTLYVYQVKQACLRSTCKWIEIQSIGAATSRQLQHRSQRTGMWTSPPGTSCSRGSWGNACTASSWRARKGNGSA